MASNEQVVLAFDAYGTLLSTESISKQLAEHSNEDTAAKVSQQWRRYQLEYTWRLNSMNQYIPFSSVTRRSLNHALAENKLTLSQSAIDTLTASYNTLSLFPDVQPLFTHLQQHSEKFYPVIFSNGTANMLSATLTQSPEIEPHAHVFKDVVVVEPVKRFKPCPSVYEYLCKKVGKKDWKEAGLKNVWLISGNPFDIVGAKACGMGACWVDRSGAGWVDQCVEGANGRPDVIVRGLDEVCQKIGQFLSL